LKFLLYSRESINSISDARTHLSLLAAYDAEKIAIADVDVAQLNKLGAEILAQKYQTKYSSWVFETPNEVKSREETVAHGWTLLSELSAEKQRVLDDHLAR
jgi:hypothetical protein